MDVDDLHHSPTGQWQTDGDSDADGTTPPSPPSNRDLLFARFVVHNGFVDEQTVVTAGRQVEATTSLADVLVATGAITSDLRQTIQQLLELSHATHHDDPEQILSRLGTATVSYPGRTGSDVTFVPVEKHGSSPTSDFGDYEILELIAEGGMGAVYKARQRTLNRLVALKLIRTGELATDEQVERFYSEAQAAGKLDHPGIVPVYEVGEWNGQHYYSMAFVEGATLNDNVKNDGPLQAKIAARILQRVAEAVQFGHDNGIVHRDIKPHNILLDRAESPRVTDFGLAKQGDSEKTVAGQVLGTPSYMPPEQAEGNQSQIGPVSDVYSLGATLYYLLTGRPPFQAASPPETMRQVVSIDPVPPRRLNPDVPRDLETICLKCLRKDRAGRYSTASELATDLGRWLENKPIVARRVGVMGKSWLWCKRKPALAVSLAVLMSVIVAGSMIGRGIIRDRDHQANLENVQTTVSSLNSSRGIILPPLKNLDSYPRDMVLAELRRQFEKTTDTSRKLPLAFALAQFGDVRVEFIVSRVEHASPYEVENFVAALGQSPTDALNALGAAGRVSTGQKNWHHKARLALLCLHLNAPALATEMCRPRPDPVQRTLFIEECANWHGNLGSLLERVRDSDDAAFRTGVALAVGNVPRADFTAGDQRRWSTTLSAWYQNAPDSLTHSVAGWVLRKWKETLPTIQPSSKPDDYRNWHVNSVGMTLLKIPSGSFVRENQIDQKTYDQKVTLTRPFLLGDREVTRAQFQRFIDDPAYPAREKPVRWQGPDTKISPTAQHPVQKVNWYDVVMYCNWLSRKEGLTPCYERTGKKDMDYEGALTNDGWRLLPKANGYRPPTEAEWEYACRAETVTTFSHGENESLMHKYAVVRADRTEIPGSKMPNGWGLFDAHGNVWEWCHDWMELFGKESTLIDPTGPATAIGKALRGGAFLSSVGTYARTASRYNFTPEGRLFSNGFRVARTVR